MSNSLARSLLTSLVVGAVSMLVPVWPRRRRPHRLRRRAARALYTEESNWPHGLPALPTVGGQFGCRFPGHAASQQARLAYWTRTLATVDSIPFEELSPEEKVNAQVFRTSLRALVYDVRFRTYELRSTATPSSGPTSRGARVSPRPARIARFLGDSATCRATSTSRSPTCGPASRAASRCRAFRSSGATRRSSRT